MVSRIDEFFKDESGQGMVEYGLIVALIALVVVGAVRILGQSVNGVYDNEELKDALS